MPSVSRTVLQSGPYRFFFFSSDRNEPAHIHVKRDGKIAKSWLAPVRMADNYVFSETELNPIAGIGRKHEAALSKCIARLLQALQRRSLAGLKASLKGRRFPGKRRLDDIDFG